MRTAIVIGIMAYIGYTNLDWSPFPIGIAIVTALALALIQDFREIIK